MTALEAIPKISELLARLIKLSKDREAAALVQKIQEYQLVIQTALLDADRKITQMERDHAQAITKLQAQQSGAQPAGFEEVMGVLWKRTPKGFEPNPYCLECSRHPIMTISPPAFTQQSPEYRVCSSGHRAPYSNPPSA